MTPPSRVDGDAQHPPLAGGGELDGLEVEAERHRRGSVELGLDRGPRVASCWLWLTGTDLLVLLSIVHDSGCGPSGPSGPPSDRVTACSAARDRRRAAVGVACGAGAALLAGCSLDRDADSDDPAATRPRPAAPAVEAADDPDAAAVDRGPGRHQELLGRWTSAVAALDPRGCSRPCTPRTSPCSRTASRRHRPPRRPAASRSTPPGRRGDAAEAPLRRRELAAQRELARLRSRAASGALARLLASMSAGVAAHLAATAPAREPDDRGRRAADHAGG